MPDDQGPEKAVHPPRKKVDMGGNFKKDVEKKVARMKG